MAEYDFPPDLLQLRRDFDTASQRAEDTAAHMPSWADIAAGAAAVSEEQTAELEGARAEARRYAVALSGHPWWAGQDRSKAGEALRKAAAA